MPVFCFTPTLLQIQNIPAGVGKSLHLHLLGRLCVGDRRREFLGNLRLEKFFKGIVSAFLIAKQMPPLAPALRWVNHSPPYFRLNFSGRNLIAEAKDRVPFVPVAEVVIARTGPELVRQLTDRVDSPL
jgi:hypothetical protein